MLDFELCAGVFISLDDGVTWTTVNAGLEQLSTTVIRSGPSDELYIGNGTGVYSEGGSVYKGSQELAIESATRQLGLTPPVAVKLTSPMANACIAAANIHLEWKALPDVCKYLVQVSVYPDFSILAFKGESKAAEMIIAQLAEVTTFNWRARAVTSSGYGAWSTVTTFTTTRLVEVERTGKNVPVSFNLEQNYPNPFNASTTIAFSVKESCRVLLELYDVLGRKVATLVDASTLATGVYFDRIQMEDFSAVKKMILLE